jgi:KDO2-lipid IV(A) lauroyltransferase
MLKKRKSHRWEYLLVKICADFFLILPYPVVSALGKLLGWTAYYCLPIRQEVALNNLAQAFPDLSLSQRKRILRKSYLHWGGMAAEFSRIRKINRKFIEKYIDFRGAEVLQKTKEIGKGTLIIAGHIGNWEIMGAVCSLLGYGVTYIVATQSNTAVDKLMDDIRRAVGIEVLKTWEAPRGMFKSLKNNRYIALMIDQDAGKDCVFVPFFGKEASTHRGPALFHLKTGAPLVISSCTRTSGLKYRIRFEEIILPRIIGETVEEKTTQIMAHLTQLLEEQIIENPTQYFWWHKRWKTHKR